MLRRVSYRAPLCDRCTLRAGVPAIIMAAPEKNRHGTPSCGPKAAKRSNANGHPPTRPTNGSYPTIRKHQRRARGALARMQAVFAASPLLLLLIGGLSRAGVHADTRGVVGGGDFGEWMPSGDESQGAAYLSQIMMFDVSTSCIYV